MVTMVALETVEPGLWVLQTAGSPSLTLKSVYITLHNMAGLETTVQHPVK